jgi:hypothetical protein
MASVRRFNWVRSPTAWESSQIWREKQRAASERFATTAAAAFDGFGSAFSSELSGKVENTTQAALSRIQSTAKAQSNAVSIVV